MKLLGAKVDIHFNKSLFLLGSMHQPYDILTGWIVEHVPQGIGDSWQFREPNSNFIIDVNPYSSSFVAIFFNPVFNQEMIK